MLPLPLRTNIGENIVTLTINDGNGNSSTATAVVTVGDNLAPVTASVLAPLTVDCNGTLSVPTALDNCAGTVIGTASAPLSFVEGGSTTITWTFEDDYGNKSYATQVYNYDDNTAPVAATEDITVYLDASGNASIAPEDVENGSTDDCGTINLVSVAPNSFYCANIGENIVTLTINDGNGNSSTA
ncbi:hypothetical protein BKM32_15500, partial [Mangrovimonas sp. DI 80]